MSIFAGIDNWLNQTAAVAMIGVCLASAAARGNSYDPSRLPQGHEYFELRNGLANSKAKFETSKTGRVAFLGGSITAMRGWRDQLKTYLQQKFPETEFEFIDAGIGSLGSVAHAFRLPQDVLSHGPIDLLFVEAAVNDTANTGRTPERALRGMEGVVRQARAANPMTDIVQMHFAMPNHLADYEAGRVPQIIALHEQVAVAYGNPSLNLAREVTDRIAAGEFTWDGDFKNLHPSPFGHQLYVNSMARMLDAAWAQPQAAAKAHSLPENPLDPQSYFAGRFGSLDEAKLLKGFTLVPDWTPRIKARTRPGFVNIPVLVATEPGAEFEFAFAGRGAGLLIGAGPDTGIIEVAIDDGSWKKVDLRVTNLYLPTAVILDDTLVPGRHVAKVRLTAEQHPKSKGTALYVFKLLEN